MNKVEEGFSCAISLVLFERVCRTVAVDAYCRVSKDSVLHAELPVCRLCAVDLAQRDEYVGNAAALRLLRLLLFEDATCKELPNAPRIPITS